jgi:CubicO group peptidase (beta-lactamase class C family)
MTRASSAALAAALLISACTPSEPAVDRVVDDVASARIDSALAAMVESGRVAGASALVFEKGRETYFGAFGHADREAGIPMARNTIVQIFSMTKPITGATLMSLYEEGAFDLDDPVSRHIPEFADLGVYAGVDDSGRPILEPPRREMTIRDLGRHTSGITSDPGSPGAKELLAAADPLNRGNTLAEMARRFGALPLWFHPGERWAYGPSVDVQAYLAERLSGRPYGELVRERVLDPLAMTDTRYVVPGSDLERFAALYSRGEDGALVQVPNEEGQSFNVQAWPLTPGGFGLTSTLDDYMRFARMLLGGGELDGVRILQPETVRLMATNALADSVTERSWLPSKGQVGFGFDFAVRVRPPASAAENNGAVGEFFWDGAATTLFWVDPVNELAAVFFVQVFPFDGTLHKAIRDAVYGPVVAPQH